MRLYRKSGERSHLIWGADGEAVSFIREKGEVIVDEPIIQCLFCTTGREERIVHTVQERTDHAAIFPQKLKPFWVKDHWEETFQPLFPGYVFVYGERPLTWADLRGEQYLLRILGSNENCMPAGLTGRDYAFAKMLLEKNGKLGVLKAVAEGARVNITDGFLKDYHGTVVKVDKRKRLAKIELDLLGETKTVWLGFAMVEEKT